jgi:hypothetical protein
MSNHYSAANLRFPGDDARRDFTDLYVFVSPDDPGKAVLIIDLNPFTTGMSAMPPFLMKSEFYPDGIYRINIDTDGDAQADRAFTFVFSELQNGKQTGTVYYATGGEARRPEPAGEMLIADTPVGFDTAAELVEAGPVRLFIGVRSDPFFADADGSFHGFQWTGQDAFADRNIQSIAGGAQRHAQRRPGHRGLGHGECASRRRDRPGGPRRASDDQSVHQPEQRQERVQPPATG